MILNFIKTGYRKVSSALSKTRELLGSQLRKILGKTIDEDALEELEELLYQADLGVSTTMALVERIREHAKKNPQSTGEEYLKLIKQELLQILGEDTALQTAESGSPTVIMMVGVNGNGKTTSAAKLGKLIQLQGQSILYGAADTFRAAAVEQLETWAKRLDAEFVRGLPNGDPAAVAFDTVSAAKARATDFAIIDTAGRLQTKRDLMQELGKIKRSCNKVIPNTPHETLLVLDATTGQNALEQARIFNEYTPISGLILAKLDGSAKGGIAIAIRQELQIPIKFIGTGEGIDDLEPFVAENFVNALLDME